MVRKSGSGADDAATRQDAVRHDSTTHRATRSASADSPVGAAPACAVVLGGRLVEVQERIGPSL
jgi:hypothetical protein